MRSIGLWVLCIVAISQQLNAFPSNIRKGYPTCRGCHVSPVGQSTLTKYGKSTSEEILSTWSYEGQGETLWGAEELPNFLDLGGDIRSILLRNETPRGVSGRSFLMQAEAELAIKLSSEIQAVASTGYYGVPVFEKQKMEVAYKLESRRYYLKLQPQKNIIVRTGRFYPAYGLMLSDHSLNIRRGMGFGQNKESYNIEMGFYNKKNEFQLTGSVDNKDGEKRTLYARSSFYLDKKFTLGANFRLGDEYAIGAHSMFSTHPFYYILAELSVVERPIEDNAKQSILSYVQAGIIPKKGIHLQYRNAIDLTQEVETTRHSVVGIWFPIPHFEFSLEYKATSDTTGNTSNSWVGVSHYYF